MTPSHYIVACFVCFGVGVYTGRVQNAPEPSQLPTNIDIASALAAEKAAKTETAAYRELVVRALDSCKQTQDAH